MGGCATLGRFILVILNIIFVLISIALIAGGVILKFTPGTIMKFLMAGVDTMVQSASLGNKIHIPDTLTFVPMFADLGLALLIGGCILFVICFLACCGACYQWRPLLIVFTIIIIVLILVVAAMGGLFLVKDSILHKNIKEELGKTVLEEYKRDPEAGFSAIMNVLEIKLKCCGFGGPSDYGAGWKTNLAIVPLACCKKMDASCATPTLANTQTDGCYEKLTKYIDDNQTWAIVALVVFLALLLLEMIFSIVIVVSVSQDNKVGPV